MNYSKVQKFLSFLLIFSIFFSFTVRVPFSGFGVFAADESYYDLVSIIVEENIYDNIKDKLDRYAKDIQGTLVNTKVVILPTPKNTSAFKIASLNESLFFEGYKGIENVSFQSKLVGTVLVGDFNLPIVYDNNNSSKTILPFVDFEDKVYIYNQANARYEKNIDNAHGLKHEIWHGLISPNFGDQAKNIQGIKDYFDKNHDFYQGSGNFKLENQILNGNKTEGISEDYKPYVFYYDGFRENSALNYNSYAGYQAYEENKEDIVYNRFSKELAEKIKNDVLGKQSESISEMISKIDPTFDTSLVNNGPDVSNAPDIQTRHIITEATKNFLDIFAKGTIGDFRKDVHNAGRYNDINSQVNVDLIPFLVTVLDLVNDELTKDINNDLENKIDEYVNTNLAKDIIIPVSYSSTGFQGPVFVNTGNNGGSNSIGLTPQCAFSHTNFYYGKAASSITKAEECSVYRGSTQNNGKLVEANRGLNIKNIQSDFSLCNMGQTQGYWGGNSPINLSQSSASRGVLELSSHNLNGAIHSIFDIAGSKEVINESKIPSPLDCFNTNMIVDMQESISNQGGDSGNSCELTYRIPLSGSAVNWSCSSSNISAPAISYGSLRLNGGPCIKQQVILDGQVVQQTGNNNTGSSEECPLGISVDTYTFKSIPSIISHKSPTALELTAEINAMATPDLPIDRDRYVDFISQKTGEYAKIDYPHLFRLDFNKDTEITLENTKIILQNYLTESTNHIDLLNNGSGSIDLLGYVQNKTLQDLQIGNETKTINHFDTLAFAIFWNNLRSSSAKYKFIFENYLSDEFSDNGIDTHLAKNKKQYEIAYLGASGDAENMYIKLDPEDKSVNPYGDIVSKNLNLSTSLMGSNIGGNTGEDAGVFQCAPPEGVPITEWIPAIVCWLKNMLPPTISISEGVCSPNLLSDNERAEILSCNGDVNKNGINDCIESKLENGNIDLSSDAGVYYYNKSGTLLAKIKDQNGNVVRLDNTTNVHFEISKIEAGSDGGKEVVYDQNNVYKQDQKIIDEYINFAPSSVIVSRGEAQYGFVSKNKDADIFFHAFIDIKDHQKIRRIYLDSSDLKVSIRGERLFAFSNVIENNSGEALIQIAQNDIKASDELNIFLLDAQKQDINIISQIINSSSLSQEKMVLSLENISDSGKKLPLLYPLRVKILQNKKQIGGDIIVQSHDLNLFKSLTAFQESGSYTLEISDNKGFKTSKTIEVIPDIASKGVIEIGTSLMKTGGSISTNLFTITDKFDNPVAGQLYDIDLEIDGDGIVFEENNTSILKLNTIEGYKAFRLKSTDIEGENILSAKVKDTNGDTLITMTKYIKTLKDISLVMKPLDGQVKVGGGTYAFEISLRGDKGNILTGFNTRVYMGINSIYGTPTKPYVDFQEGKAIIEFKTGTVAGKNIPIEFQVEGFGDILYKSITIYPEFPIKLDLSLSQSKIEASSTASSLLKVEMKDRYGNIVFNDSLTQTSLEILDKYSHVITADEKNKVVQEGVSYFTLFGTLNPGTAYFKVKANPGFENNSFVITDEKGSVTLSGVSENVGRIETFYFWDGDTGGNRKYNAMYTTLLGAPYGDITQENYLAGNLLFQNDNRALAVTSLLNNPYDYNDIIQITPKSGIHFVQSSSDLTQDIQPGVTVEGGKLYVDFWNESLHTYIGKVVYNFGNNTVLQTCDTVDNCQMNGTQTSISLTSQNTDFPAYLDGNQLVLQDRFGKNLLEIDKNGQIIKGGMVRLELDMNNNKEYSLFNIISGDAVVGNIIFHFVNSNINISREKDLFESKIQNLSNAILVFLATNTYDTRDIYTSDTSSKAIYYHDPFASNYTLNNFARGNSSGYENFAKTNGLGWKDGNKTLLSFSSGKSVGESVKDYASFSVINLGDPVVSLKKISKKLPQTTLQRKFDATIGKLLSNDTNIFSYQIFDYNKDNADDILLIKNDNYFKLLENTSTQSQFLDMGNLAYLIDLGNKELVKTGDFTGDGYDDIFFVNQDGIPFLLNNHLKDFVRISLKGDFNLLGKVIRAEVFDMDNDGKSDIVTLDDAGQINIFYGGGASNLPKFTKLTLSESYGITLNNNVRNDHSLVYFDGLLQLGQEGNSPALLQNNVAYLERVNQNLANNTETNQSGFDETIYENFIFEQVSYDTNSTDVLGEQQVLNNPQILDSQGIQTTFIKGEYSDLEGLLVEKKFLDRNGGYLRSSDIVDVTITLKNIRNTTLHNIAYIEDTLELFTLDKKSIQTSEDVNIVTEVPLHSFLIDGFSLSKNDTITFTYQMTTLPIKYGYLKVGLYEDGELGNDNYGDIIVKDTYENCSQTAEIFRSIGARDYGKGFTAPICDDDKIKLPDAIAQNAIDENGNGLPDYIDALTQGNVEKIQNYAQEKLLEISRDLDRDGIPDREDRFNSSGGITSNLTSVTENVSGILDGVDAIMQGLSCGFGGGGCISTPLNWAPLAPGSDPTLFGFPIGDGLNVGEGIPIFSALTGINVPTPGGCYQVPAFWPASPFMYSGVCNTSIQAGGYLGTFSPTNFFRLFVTPTLTGAVGVAACFGGPAIIAGNSIPKGLSPLVPGGNCIVAAAPLFTCNNDGSDGDIGSTGFADVRGNFALYNGNCNSQSTSNISLSSEAAKNYLDYKKSPQTASPSAIENLKTSLTTLSQNSNDARSSFGTEPLISMNGGEGGTEFKVDLDTDALKNGDYSDILKISMKRVPSFPGFLMDWVTRQIEEIVTKLTDFPTVFVILPDFTGIFDGSWGKRTGNSGKYDEDFSTVDKKTDEYIENKKIRGQVKEVTSGIKEAYEFLANIPLVQIEQDTVNVNVPWIDKETIDKTLLDRKNTKNAREEELNRAKNAWSLGKACNYNDPAQQKTCEEENKLAASLIVDTEQLIHSLEQNLEAIQSYKDIPKDINKMVNMKQYYLEQILCNIEAISSILGGWIGKNGKRFKAWIELYVLIKAILKSWQLLIDIFIEYDAECHQCKNERSDLMTSIWSIIDMIIPKIPIIRFPKWPDIILDLHNIRASLNIVLPEYSFETRPILLPALPELHLPDVPSLSLTVVIPSLPILPTLEIGMLPDLPSLPTVELPNLPPPPTVPKLFASLEAILDILKLITKIMCLLRSSPFVPEWRAGDLISFITERQGFMSLDFLHLSLPQFSFPFVDAIEVTSYVNLELESDFIVELARQVAMPINTFTNDIVHLLDIQINDIDLSGVVPESIDYQVGGDETSSIDTKQKAFLFSVVLVKGIRNIIQYIDTHKNETVDALTFKKIVNENLASKNIASNPKGDELRKLWQDVNNLTYSKENRLIQELEQNSREKFQVLSDIINTEILKNKELKNNIEALIQPSFIKSVVQTSNSDIEAYNTLLKQYNDKFISSALALKESNENKEKQSLKEDGLELMKNIKTPLLAINEPITPISDIPVETVSTQNSCQQQATADYKYTYKGLYIVENNISYRLFDYLDRLDGKEKSTIIDFDKDTDEDLIYMADGEIFLKENLNIQGASVFVSTNPLVVKSNDNKFYTEDIKNPFYESVNNFRELGASNNAINMTFSSSTQKDIVNYRAEFFRITDRFIRSETPNYEPKNLTKSLVDSFADIDTATYLSENDIFISRKNLGYIRDIGFTKGAKMYVKNMIDIANNLKHNTIVHLSPFTKIYAGGSSFTLKYTLDNTDEVKALVVRKYQNIELKQNITVTGITGNAYIDGVGFTSLEGEDIRSKLYMPLFPGESIQYNGERLHLSEKSHIDIEYYDTSEALLDFRDIDDYLIYNLGTQRENYVLRLERENDFYYAKIRAFKENEFSTHSNKTLLSPQVQADTRAPDLFVDFSIRVPVYQTQIFDLTPYIFEDGGIRAVSDIFIDSNITQDTSGDGNPKNDRDTTGIKIIKSASSIQVEFGPFTTVTKRKIGVTLTDINNNTSYTEVPFEVYSPKPKIENYTNDTIQGSINENLTSEPVTLYRYRGGNIEKLEDVNGTDTVLTKDGNYDFSVGKGISGLTLKMGDVDIATVNEMTGQIKTQDIQSKIKVLPSNHFDNTSLFPEIRLEYNGSDIYYEYIKINPINSVELVTDFSGINKQGVYVQFTNTSSYGYYKIPEAVEFNPGSFVIYRNTDTEKEPLFTIFKDGTIHTINEFYTLEYDTFGDYIVFKLMDKHFNREVARVLFQVNGEYVMEKK